MVALEELWTVQETTAEVINGTTVTDSTLDGLRPE